MFKSLLFIPANNEKLLMKAETSQADSIIFDLEDSVIKTKKNEARLLLYHFFSTFENRDKKKIIVRINQLDTFGEDDINALGKIKKIDAFMLPKAKQSNIVILDTQLTEIEGLNNIDEGYFKIFPLIETPESILDVKKITKASNRIIGMLFGAEDYTSCMGLERTMEGSEIFLARSLFAIACSAAGIDAIDTPCTEIKDMDVVEIDAENGKKLGMTGKAAIHPAQLPIINEIFHPSEEELEIARKIVEANEAAIKSGSGAFSVNGKMVDLPIVERAMKVLDAVENISSINGKQWQLCSYKEESYD